jgi:hypothetical protein
MPTTRTPLRPGDRVRFSRRWLQSTATYSGDLPALKGTVQETRTFCRGGNTYCRVLWDTPYFADEHGNPSRFSTVLSSNLHKLGTREFN